MLPAAGCARCNEPATTVVVEFSAMTAYVDLCEQHLGELPAGGAACGRDELRNRIDPTLESSPRRRFLVTRTMPEGSPDAPVTRKTYFVSASEGGWNVTKDGGLILGKYPSKEGAAQAARIVAKSTHRVR